MTLLNYITSILLTIIEFVNSVLFPFLSNYIFEEVVITVIISFASGSKAARILDATAKVIGSAAGAIFLYNN